MVVGRRGRDARAPLRRLGRCRRLKGTARRLGTYTGKLGKVLCVLGVCCGFVAGDPLLGLLAGAAAIAGGWAGISA
eukprot:3140077-Alexandrium_andersonii.AAC.1